MLKKKILLFINTDMNYHSD